MMSVSENIDERVNSLDWGNLSTELDARGSALIKRLMTPDEASQLRPTPLLLQYGVARLFENLEHYPVIRV